MGVAVSRPVGFDRHDGDASSDDAGIRDEITYVRRHEKGVQTPDQTLASRRGSCRDLAVLMMEGARSLGVASRFVSGYIYTPGHSGLAGGGATHAWMQAYLPGAGWIDFDPRTASSGTGI